MPGPRTGADFQERAARLLLLLTLAHTVPVIWLTPVAGGTAPTVALLAVGAAGLLSFDTEGLTLGLIALLPGLVYLALCWLVSWAVARSCRNLGSGVRTAVLTMLVIFPLASVYFPIYVAGGHNSSHQATLLELLGGVPRHELFIAYWAGLHVVLVGLLAVQMPAEGTPGFAFARRWTGPVLWLCVGVLISLLGAFNFVAVVCRPLAYLGSDEAQLCVARNDPVEARYWYERAAVDGNAEALAWIVEHTPDRKQRLEWLRRGAHAGDPGSQYRLAEHLRRFGGDESDTERALQAAAAAGYGPAQLAVVEGMTAEVLRTGSPELLAERNALLEQAAANGSRAARLELAEQYSRGSMGYPLDLARAREYYEALAAEGEMIAEDSPSALAGDSYRLRLEQLDAWEAGLAAGDPEVQLELAKRYLGSPLPGPGVKKRGMQLFETVAAEDPAAREELIVMLRTGTDGAEKDLDAAREWLLVAARAGEPEAMERVIHNYMSAQEGFERDYPEARRWIDSLIIHYQLSGGEDAERRVSALRADLRFLDRLDGMAGGRLLGPGELEALGERTDADAQYDYALQLLAGAGAERRKEAVARLQAAAELGHAEAAWRLVAVYERGFPDEVNPAAARQALERAASLHHYDAVRELASRYEYGKDGYPQDLPRAIGMYEAALEAGRDNRYGWNLSGDVFNHFPWLESRLKQARLKLESQLAATDSPAR